MIILSWNCHAACKPFALDYVRTSKLNFKPDIIILLETYVQLAKVRKTHCALSMNYNVACILQWIGLMVFLYFGKGA